VAVLPMVQGKIDPDEFARAHGREGVNALLAAAVPLTDFLIDRAAERHCGAAPIDAPVEGKLAAVRELAPLVRLAPEGLARATFEERIARRIGLDLQALRDEIQGRRTSAPPPDRRARPAQGPGPRATLLLPGPAVDALGILAGHPDLGPVGAAGPPPRLFPDGPLADLVRDLCREPIPLETVLARLEPAADARAVQRVRGLASPPRPAAEAERELRRAAVEAKIEAIRREQSHLLAMVARAGSPPPEDLTRDQLTLQRRRVDLERRREELRRT
jgi:DNA primase